MRLLLPCCRAVCLPFLLLASTKAFQGVTRSVRPAHLSVPKTLLPPLLAASVSVSDSFDGGNIAAEEMDTASNNLVKLYIKPDVFSELEGKSHFQHFAFRSTVSDLAPGAAIKVTYSIENAGQASFEKAFDSSATCYTTSIEDTNSWKRETTTRYENGKLIWDHVHERNGSVYFSYFPLYTYPQHLELISKCAASANVKSLGKTIDGREIDCVVAGTGERVAWIIHRQHPGESMSEYFAEGLLTRLLGIDNDGRVDGLVRRLLQDYTFYIVPNMCPDGAVRGHLRTNAMGANLNREWFDSPDYPAPTIKNSPEVFHVLNTMKETGVDLFLDVHGDEALPFNFLSGCEETVHWGPRLKALHGAFLASYQRSNPDMQSEIGYPTPPPGSASKNIGTNAIANRFNCLASTLEMPFQDCWTNPDPERGWSPSRARQLGASLLDAMTYIHPYLRAPGPFWEELPANDAYVRPRYDYKNEPGTASTNGEVASTNASKSKESGRKRKKSKSPTTNRDGRNENGQSQQPNTQRDVQDGSSSGQPTMNQVDRGGNSARQPDMNQGSQEVQMPMQSNPSQDGQEVRMPMQPNPSQEVRMPMQPDPNQKVRTPSPPNINQGQNAGMPNQRNMDPSQNERFSFSRRSNENYDFRDEMMPGPPYGDRNGPNGVFSDQSSARWGRQVERHLHDGSMPIQGNGQGGVRWQPGMEPDGKYPGESWLPDPKAAERKPANARRPESRGDDDGQFGSPSASSRGPESGRGGNGQFRGPPDSSQGPGPRGEDGGQFGGPMWQPPNQEAGGQRPNDSWGPTGPRPGEGQFGGPMWQPPNQEAGGQHPNDSWGAAGPRPGERENASWGAAGPKPGERTNDSWGAVGPKPRERENDSWGAVGPTPGDAQNGQNGSDPGPSNAKGDGNFDGRPSQPNGPAEGFDAPRERGDRNYEGRQRQPGATNSRGPAPGAGGDGSFASRQGQPNSPGGGAGRFDDPRARGPGGGGFDDGQRQPHSGGGGFGATSSRGPGGGGFDDRQRQPHSGGGGFGATNSRGPGGRGFDDRQRQPHSGGGGFGATNARGPGGGNFDGRQRQPHSGGGGFGATNAQGPGPRAGGGGNFESRQRQQRNEPFGATHSRGQGSRAEGGEPRQWQRPNGSTGSGGQTGNYNAGPPMSRGPGNGARLWKPDEGGVGRTPTESSSWESSVQGYGPDPVVWRQSNNAGSQDGFNSWEYTIDTDDELDWQS